MQLCLFTKAAKLLPRWWGPIKFIFCESWCSPKVCFDYTLAIYVRTEDVRDSSLMKLLYADDLVLCGESLNEVTDKYGRWRNTVEGKGLRANVNKMKGIQLLIGKKSNVSKVDLCGVCDQQVGCNSLQCTKCQKWVQCCCSDVPRQVRLPSYRDVFVYKHGSVIIVQ